MARLSLGLGVCARRLGEGRIRKQASPSTLGTVCYHATRDTNLCREGTRQAILWARTGHLPGGLTLR